MRFPCGSTPVGAVIVELDFDLTALIATAGVGVSYLYLSRVSRILRTSTQQLRLRIFDGSDLLLINWTKWLRYEEFVKTVTSSYLVSLTIALRIVCHEACSINTKLDRN